MPKSSRKSASPKRSHKPLRFRVKGGTIKFMCVNCEAVHWYIPADGCKNCNHKIMELLNADAV